MYHTIAEFLDDWKKESASTLCILETLTDASLAQKVDPEGRTLGYLAWHVALSIAEMASRAGLVVPGPAEDSDEPASASEIAAVYRDVSVKLAESIAANWTDASLDEEVDMYGQLWKKSVVLAVLIRHEIHHRGQMTVLMRQAGLKVPGVCGPSREEWAKFGMPPMK